MLFSKPSTLWLMTRSLWFSSFSFIWWCIGSLCQMSTRKSPHVSLFFHLRLQLACSFTLLPFASYTNMLRSDSGWSQAIWPWSHWIPRWVVSSGSGLSVCATKQNLHWSGSSHLSPSSLLRPARDWHIHTETTDWVREWETEMEICYLNLSSCLLSPRLHPTDLNTWICSVRVNLELLGSIVERSVEKYSNHNNYNYIV